MAVTTNEPGKYVVPVKITTWDTAPILALEFENPKDLESFWAWWEARGHYEFNKYTNWWRED